MGFEGVSLGVSDYGGSRDDKFEDLLATLKH